MKKNEIIDAFKFRHACKEFDKNKKVSDEDFNFIMETARLSPSSFGTEPWHFMVLQDKDLREELKAKAWGAAIKLDTASHFVIALTMKKAKMHYDSEYLAWFRKEIQKLPEDVIEMLSGFYKTFQISDFELDTDRAMFDWASKQCYIPLANMMTAAALIGIDSCPMEGFNQKEVDTFLHDKLGVDTHIYGISYMVAFGYRVNEPFPKTRRDIKDIITWK